MRRLRNTLDTPRFAYSEITVALIRACGGCQKTHNTHCVTAWS